MPTSRRLPPVWLASSAVAAAITVAFGVARWVQHFVADPAAQDLRLHLIAARVGLAYGWSKIYDPALQAHVAAGLGPGSPIDSMHLFVSPPPSAWMLVPLASQGPAVSYLVWTVVSLAALAAAAWIVVPGSRFVRITVLLASLALWPVHYEFWQGQTVAMTMALLALTYHLLERNRWAAAGLVMAAAFCLKPQDALLLPLALAISGRWRPVAAFAAAGAVVVAVSAATLGPAGITDWLRDLAVVRADPNNAPLTYSFLFGRDAVATGLELGLGVAALVLAWMRRDRLDLVFCLGLVGTTMSASYLHEHDIAVLVVGAWVLLRSRLSIPQRAWLLLGVAAVQVVALGQPIPILLWEPVWMVLLALEPRLSGRMATAPQRLTADPVRA